MKVKIIGMAKRNAEDKQGRKVVYSNLFYTEEFDEYTKRSQITSGVRCGSVNTSLPTDSLAIGDVVNLDYAPTGFERNGQPEFRLQNIELVQIDTALEKAAAKAADKK